jgi:hypothetical protein
MYKYLTENYYIKKSDVGNYGIYLIDDNSRWATSINPKILIEELVKLFGFKYTKTKWLIHSWVKLTNKNIDLKFFWSTNWYGFFPTAKRVSSTLMATDLVNVEPLSTPTNEIHYMNIIYDLPTPNVDPIISNPTSNAFSLDEWMKEWAELSEFYNKPRTLTDK